MSEAVRAGLASQFQSWTNADVCIRFHLERELEQQHVQEGASCAAGGLEGGAMAGIRFVGDPLPAHKIILILASTFFEAKLQNACWQGTAPEARGALQGGSAQADSDPRPQCKMQKTDARSEVPSTASSGGCQGAAVSALPEVHVPLSSEDEEPIARQAIEYIYTGRLSADLGFEALLRVRQQACYLGVKHCPQACDQAMLAWLQAGEEQGQQQQQEGGSTSTGAAPSPRAVVAYHSHALFPEPGTSADPASFDAVRSALAKQLVSHFGDAVAALTRPDLYRQLLQLPAVAVRELLAADDFGTDSEDSVLLLLACWLEAQEEEQGVSAATRAELCGLVRLHRLGRTYLHHVLPAYESIDISRTELGFLLRYVGADAKEKEDMLRVDPQRELSPWYCSPARRQAVPEEGRTIEWSISREELEQGLREMVEDQEVAYVDASVGASAAALASGCQDLLACGLYWWVSVYLDPKLMDPDGKDAAAGPGAAAIWLTCRPSGRFGEVTGLTAGVEARVVVRGRAGGQRKDGWTGVCPRSMNLRFKRGAGWHAALKLQPHVPAATAAAAAATAAAGSGSGGAGAAGGGGGGDGSSGEMGQVQEEQRQQQEQQQVEAEVAAQLARFSEWMQDGKITGSITFLRPS